MPADAINRVGVTTYGADWCGHQANALYKLTARIRYYDRQSASERDMVAREAKARRQHDDILTAVHRAFLGTPPSFEDAVPTVVMSDVNGQLYNLPPQAWIDDRAAWNMLQSGRVLFGSATHPAGVILTPEAAFNEEKIARTIRAQPMTAQRLAEMSDAEFATAQALGWLSNLAATSSAGEVASGPEPTMGPPNSQPGTEFSGDLRGAEPPIAENQGAGTEDNGSRDAFKTTPEKLAEDSANRAAPADGTTAAPEQQPAAMGHPELDAPQATVEAAEQQSAEALDGKPGESLAPPKKRGGRPQSPARFFARDIAFKWLDENGTSQPGDGEQAKLERHITDKLAKRNEFPAESTIRDWVGNFIAEYEAGRRI